MKDKKPLTWIPLFIDKHLFGSTRYELDPAERSVWIDLLAFSGKDNGHIRANEGVPYHLRQLAGIFNDPEDLLKQTIRKCIKFGKIEILKDQTMYLPSWKNYRLSDRHVRRLADEMSAKPDTMSKNRTLREDKSIEDKSIEKEEDIKENNKSKSLCLKKYSDIDKQLTQLLIDLILKNDSNSSIIRRLTLKRQEIWMDECRKIREIDKRTPEQIKNIIIFSQNDPFWKSNILSMPKLRKQFDQLWLKAKKEKYSGIKEWLNEK